MGCCIFDPDKRRFVVSVLDVLTLEGERMAQVNGFIDG
jgi:hypothetical protein